MSAIAGSPTVAARLDRIPPMRMHRRMAVAVGFANFFDLYDIFLGGVLAAVLAEPWNLSTNGKALVIASGFGGMFFGAVFLGTAADYFGRRKMFLINLMIYSGFSFAAAFSPDLTWLAILRFGAGIGLGAELSLSDTYLSELLPRQVRGRYMAGAYTLGFFGVPLVALVGAGFVAGHEILGIEGWRWLLVIGSLGAGVGFLLGPRRLARRGRRLHEAPQPARVAALARDPRPPRGGRPVDDGARGARDGRAGPLAPARAGAGRGGAGGGRDDGRDLPAAVPPADRDALHLPVPADGGLLRLRHARPARAGRQGLRHRREPRLLGADLPRLPARLGAVRAAHGALRAQAPHRRVGDRDGRLRSDLRLRELDGGHRRRGLPGHHDEQRLLERLPHLPGGDLPHPHALDGGQHGVLAEPSERSDAAIHHGRGARPSRPHRRVPRLGRDARHRGARRRRARTAEHGAEPRDVVRRGGGRGPGGRRRAALPARRGAGRDHDAHG